MTTVLIISMQSAHERRAFQTRQAQRLGFAFDFVDGVDAASLDRQACQRGADRWPSPTPIGDIACFHAHRRAWGIAGAASDNVVILEDDVVLEDGFTRFIDRIDHIALGRHLLDLEYAPGRHFLSKRSVMPEVLEAGFQASRIFQNRVGLAAYAGAPQTFAKLASHYPDYPGLIDVVVWNRNDIRPLQIEPALAVQKRFLIDTAADAFVRPADQTVFHPRNPVRRTVERLKLEALKGRNLVRTWLHGGVSRDVLIRRGRFRLSP